MEAVYNITEACYTDLQNKDKQEIDKKFWDQCIDLFKNDSKIVAPPSLKMAPEEVKALTSSPEIAKS